MRPLVPVAALALFTACTGDGPAPSYLDAYVEDAEVAPDTAAAPDVETVAIDGGTCGGGLRLVRVSPWLGGGLSVAVELTGAGGAPGRVEGATATIGGRPASMASAWQRTGVTGLVLVDAAARDLARDLVTGLPDGEVFVVWSGGRLEAEATTDKAHVLARLDAADPSTALPVQPDWSAIVKSLVELGGADGPLAKTLVVAGTPPAPLSDAVAVEPLRAGLADALVARRVGLARLGTCERFAVGERVEVAVDGVSCGFIAPEPEAYVADEACDAAAAARDAWPFGDHVDLLMTSEETAIYEARRAGPSKEDFTGSIDLGPGTPLPATLHFRGQTSLDCERKSVTIDLAGPAARRLAPGAASDELFLIAMCKDVGYYNQLLGDELAHQRGLFPLARRLVTFRVNGASQGVYLLMQHPTETVKDDTVALDALIRRGLDQDGNRPEVQYAASGDPAAALASYDAMVALGADPEAVEGRLDLDHYLEWMALAVLLHNGDYVDEVFFHGAREAGMADPYYRILAWDPDDLWSACHRNGRDAIPDAHGILYCAEADVDHLLYANPAIYDRFVGHLEALLEVYTMERITAEMADVRDQLFAAVADDETAAAMVELVGEHPEAKTRDGFQAVVEALMNSDLAESEAWLAELQQKIAAYRSAR